MVTQVLMLAANILEPNTSSDVKESPSITKGANMTVGV
jgi:hypothetical protein